MNQESLLILRKDLLMAGFILLMNLGVTAIMIDNYVGRNVGVTVLTLLLFGSCSLFALHQTVDAATKYRHARKRLTI